jgi:hypothetical protein
MEIPPGTTFYTPQTSDQDVSNINVHTLNHLYYLNNIKLENETKALHCSNNCLRQRCDDLQRECLALKGEFVTMEIKHKTELNAIKLRNQQEVLSKEEYDELKQLRIRCRLNILSKSNVENEIRIAKEQKVGLQKQLQEEKVEKERNIKNYSSLLRKLTSVEKSNKEKFESEKFESEKLKLDQAVYKTKLLQTKLSEKETTTREKKHEIAKRKYKTDEKETMTTTDEKSVQVSNSISLKKCTLDLAFTASDYNTDIDLLSTSLIFTQVPDNDRNGNWVFDIIKTVDNKLAKSVDSYMKIEGKSMCEIVMKMFTEEDAIKMKSYEKELYKKLNPNANGCNLIRLRSHPHIASTINSAQFHVVLMNVSLTLLEVDLPNILLNMGIPRNSFSAIGIYHNESVRPRLYSLIIGCNTKENHDVVADTCNTLLGIIHENLLSKKSKLCIK